MATGADILKDNLLSKEYDTDDNFPNIKVRSMNDNRYYDGVTGYELRCYVLS
ncbi:hypothetical protein CHS0354_019356 [Potamilus streckersoni]|uniref:Uncharacterized protein n=1 Tax=Potamilus streckersoni TaxID=2493646 RepID=A0AAE0VVY0_9BIVA|nr:hypothetical protein CHS0354_019356 [Potamilus streckersoni]